VLFRNRDQLISAVQEESARKRRALALTLLEEAVESVDPARCTREGLEHFASEELGARSPLYVVALGKASHAMAREALSLVKVEGGIVHCFESGQLGPLRLEHCGHPLPVGDAVEQGERMLGFAHSLGAGDDVLVLLSGGASAMLEAPVAGIQLQEIRQTTEVLLACGADIGAVNTVRRCLSRTKGGGLLKALHPARVFNIIISDVPGQPPSVVSSGPTLPPVAGRAEDVVERYGLGAKLPKAVLDVLRRAPPRSWNEPSGLRFHTFVAADNDSAVEAIVAAGVRMGLDLRRAAAPIYGEAREAALTFYRDAVRAGGDGYVGGGECTVTVRGEGRGGRAQEFVLSAATAAKVGLVAALGTDGIDGASEAAGALFDEQVLAVCSSDFTPQAYLDHNDSGGFFSRVGTQLITGRTGTNVSDIYLFLR
jgi:glycerate-2-kinase